jgi:1-phosphofructokinase
MMKNEITVVNLNPCIDWSWHIGGFTYGGMNRVKSTRQDVAGKGINVCAALKNLGLSPLCMGFNFRDNGTAITHMLDESGIPHDFVTVDGAVRVNIKLYDESGTMTEINQAGAYVPPPAQEELIQKITRRSNTAGILVLSGSRPSGVSADFYARLCAAWEGRIILDTEGEALLSALLLKERAPCLIKPNLYELESTFKVKLPTHTQITDFCRQEIIKRGVKIACVSLGAEGAVLITENEAHFSPALPLEIKAVQGAGDAMVAGLVYGFINALDNSDYYADLLRFAMAAAAATVVREGTQMCDRNGFDRFMTIIYNQPTTTG